MLFTLQNSSWIGSREVWRDHERNIALSTHMQTERFFFFLKKPNEEDEDTFSDLWCEKLQLVFQALSSVQQASNRKLHSSRDVDFQCWFVWFSFFQ